MVKAVDNWPTTPAERLRADLNEAENLAVNFPHAPEKARRLLELLDNIDLALVELDDTGLDLRTELARLEAVHNQVHRRKAALLRELAHLGGLSALRQGAIPAETAWWWHLDHELAEDRRHALRRYALMAAGLIVVAGIVAVIWHTFFRPDPLTLALYDNQIQAASLIQQGQFDAAIPLIEENHTLAPDEPEWGLQLGILKELTGNEADAQALFEAACPQIGSEAACLTIRGQYYLEASAAERAVAVLEPSLALDETSAMTHFLLGRTYDTLGRRAEAIQSFERAVELAGDGEETLYVTAKMELSRLLQTIPDFSTPTPAA